MVEKAAERCTRQEPPASITAIRCNWGRLEFTVADAGKRTARELRRLEEAARTTCVICGARGAERTFELETTDPLCDVHFRQYVEERGRGSPPHRLETGKHPEEVPRHWHQGGDGPLFQAYYDRDASPD